MIGVLSAGTPQKAPGQLQVGDQETVGVQTAPNDSAGLRVKKKSTTIVEGAAIDALTWDQGQYALRAVNTGGWYEAYGVYGRAETGAYANFGVYGKAVGTRDTDAYGVYGKVSGQNGYLYAGYFNGDVTVTGNFSNPSDRKLKRNVQGLGQGLPTELVKQVEANAQEGGNAPSSARSSVRSKVLRLKPKSFRYQQKEYSEMGLPSSQQYGLVAQEVEQVFPALVNEEIHPVDNLKRNDQGGVTGTESIKYKSVNYLQLVPLLVQTIKEQQAEIDALQEQIQALEQGQ